MTTHSGRKTRDIVPTCPNCFSSEHVVEIVYGYPSDELLISDREDFVLGGCVISHDSPGWFCQDCKHGFGEVPGIAEE